MNQFQSTTKITTTNYQLVVAEDLSLNGRLNVSQDASFNGNVSLKGNVGIGGSLSTSGAVNIGGGLKFNSITMNGVYYNKIGNTPSANGYGTTITNVTSITIPTAIRTSTVATFDGTTITFNNTGYYTINLHLNYATAGAATYCNIQANTGANVSSYSGFGGGGNYLPVTTQSTLLFTSWLVKVNSTSSDNTCSFTITPQGGGPGIREAWWSTTQYGFISIVYTDTV